ncbi:hypothetical protein AX16_005205 [Volvariella volvacea WC 439]|nr:hypothetical protein AX16_005205 [Volvariella volvacea WC 439]
MEEKDGQNNLYLMTMGILAPYRSRRLGSQSLEVVLAAAAASTKPKISKIYLHVQTSNHDAKRFYEKHGFKEVEISKNYYKKIEPHDAWVLEKLSRLVNWDTKYDKSGESQVPVMKIIMLLLGQIEHLVPDSLDPGRNQHETEHAFHALSAVKARNRRLENPFLSRPRIIDLATPFDQLKKAIQLEI